MILFAFAGNMDVEEFAKTVPSARKIGVAKLPGYSFVFNKTAEDQSSKANIALSNNPDDAVWGVLIELNDNEQSNFYNGETWSIDFKLDPVTCIGFDGQVHIAKAFVAQPHAINTHLLPYDWYHEKIIILAKHAGLPGDYIDKLSAMSFKTDPDTPRRLMRLKKIKK